MNRYHGVFLDTASADTGDLDRSAFTGLPIDWSWHEQTAAHERAGRLAGAQIVVSNKVVLDAAVLAAAVDLQLVCIAATGTNNIDLEAAAAGGITVCNVPSYATPSVVQHVFSLVLELTTRARPYRDAVEAGAWQRSDQFCLLDFPIRELAGRTFGIIGYGVLGQAVARVAEAFGMHVLIANSLTGESSPGRVPLETLYAKADVISLHVPLTDASRGLIDDRAIAAMPDDAILINTARGGIVDEAALAAALKAGRLGGAGIDVLAQEPPVHGSPLLDAAVPNLIVTPHIAWASHESRQRLLDTVAANIAAWLAGAPQHVVVR